MELGWFESILYGLFSGLTEILPVSAHAHKMIMMKLFGISAEPELLGLMLHIGTLGAVYYACQNHIVRILRARRLARVPKRKRKRPLDTRSLMDFRLWMTMLVPVVLAFLAYNALQGIGSSMLWIAGAMFLNGVILYLPQFFPGGNRDSRTLSPVQGLLMGLGGAVGVIPGLSGMGAATAISSVCAVDKGYGLQMTLLMELGICAGYLFFDVYGMVSAGMESVGFAGLLSYIIAGAAAFGGATLGIRLMRMLVSSRNYTRFALYCWGIALFTFIMNLIA